MKAGKFKESDLVTVGSSDACCHRQPGFQRLFTLMFRTPGMQVPVSQLVRWY